MAERFARNPDVLLTELDDGTATCLLPATSFHFKLNRTALFLWKALEQGPLSATDLVERLTSSFRVSSETARSDVETVVAHMVRESLLSVLR